MIHTFLQLQKSETLTHVTSNWACVAAIIAEMRVSLGKPEVLVTSVGLDVEWPEVTMSVEVKT